MPPAGTCWNWEETLTHRTLKTRAGTISFEQTGDGPDLVVLHSLLTDRRAFDPVVPVWARSLTVSLVDLPGFGLSSPVGPSIDAYADAVAGFLEEGGFDPATTVVAGNGFGAFIALGLAVRHGSRFARLCLVGCGVGFPDAARTVFATMAAQVEEGGMEAVVEVAVRRIFPEGHLEAHPELIEQRRRVLLETAPEAFITACVALQQVDYRSQAGQVSNPTLIVVGSEDGATPPPMAREAHASIPGSRLVEIEGVGHAPQLQDPPRFLEAVEGFLFSPAVEEKR